MDAPPPFYQNLEREHGMGVPEELRRSEASEGDHDPVVEAALVEARRPLRSDDPFWDAVAEYVEWRINRGGADWRIVKRRNENIMLAWPDGRSESVTACTSVIVQMDINEAYPGGRASSFYHPNDSKPGVPIRELYLRSAPFPRWIGRLRSEEVSGEDEEPSHATTFESYVVVEPPAPVVGPPPRIAPTLERIHGSLEATGGWLDELASPSPATQRRRWWRR